jgi:VanZ family protein
MPSLRTWSSVLWALLCAFIIYGSLGTWAAYRPGIWAPTLVNLPDVAENVLLYVGFGVLGGLSTRDRYRRHWFRLVMRLTLFAVIFSAANEAGQLYTLDRVASVTDIVSAAIGTFAGSLLVVARSAPK